MVPQEELNMNRIENQRSGGRFYLDVGVEDVALPYGS